MSAPVSASPSHALMAQMGATHTVDELISSNANDGTNAGLRMMVAVRLIASDATDRLVEAVRQPTRDDAAEESLRNLLTALHAAYPQVLQTEPRL